MNYMIQKIINKGLLLLLVFLILFVLLPFGLGFDLHVSSHSLQELVYSRPIEFENLQGDTRLLIRDKENNLSIQSNFTIHPVTRTLLLETQETVSEKGIIGEAVVSIPYLGYIYTTLLAVEYDIKLQIIVIILILYVLPEILRSLMKKWRIQSQKMVQ